MKLTEALLKNEKENIPSLTVTVISSHGVRQNVDGAITVYKVTDSTKKNITLKCFFMERVTLFEGCIYKISSIPTDNGMKGIEIGIFSGQKEIRCMTQTQYELLGRDETQQQQQQIIMETPQETPVVDTIQPPISRDNLQNYMLGMYFQTKQKALTKEISDEHAHQIALKAMELVPTYWFGEKPLNL